MATIKRKYSIIARSTLDHENPVADEKNARKKSKVNGGIPTLSSWPGDQSNTFERYANKTKSKRNRNVDFCDLPDEIILVILSYLNRVSLVDFTQTCRRYRAIGYHPTLWRSVDISYKNVDAQQINSLLQRGIITLKMYQTTVKQDIDFTLIQPSVLCHLDLTAAILTSELLASLLSSCRSLRKLSLESLPMNYEIIEKVTLNENIDTLNLAMCTGLTYDCCQLITRRLCSLRCLNIAWTELTFQSVQYLCETMPRSIEQLNISGQRCHLNDENLEVLLRRALRLRVLDISDCVLITDQSIKSLNQHSRLLTHLSASRCYLLTGPNLSTLKSLPAFSALDIFGTLPQVPLQQLRSDLGTRIHVNMFPFSGIARPTTGIQRTSIWGLRTRL